MKPISKTIQIFGKAPLETFASKTGRKKINAKTIKMPVLMIGTNRLAIINATVLFLFFNKLKTSPLTKPARVHFSKQASTVPATLTGMKTAIVDGDNKAMMPLKKPTIAPETGPAITAAKTIATNEMLMLTGPNCK